MSKIKIIFYLILGFVAYKGYEAFTNFEIGVSDRITEIEEKADFERQGEVIALMMYLGDPPKSYFCLKIYRLVIYWYKIHQQVFFFFL